MREAGLDPTHFVARHELHPADSIARARIVNARHDDAGRCARLDAA
jgi:hypothetical protein